MSHARAKSESASKAIRRRGGFDACSQATFERNGSPSLRAGEVNFLPNNEFFFSPFDGMLVHRRVILEHLIRLFPFMYLDEKSTVY